MPRLDKPGWENYKAYPLLVAGDTEQALIRYMADKQLSKGKALNQLVRHALAQGGYLTSEEACKHEFEGHTGDNGAKFFECARCKEVYVPV